MNEEHVQILIYTSYLHIIGGIETFIKSYVELMSPYYDIGILCPRLPGEMRVELMAKVPVWTKKEHICCDTLIMIRMNDNIPDNVTYNQSVRMCHACRLNKDWKIIMDCDYLVHVSEASKKTFETDGHVILNPLIKTKERAALMLVSATRIPAPDKGKNAERMLRLARMLERASIPFIWLNFSDAPLTDAPRGFFNVGAAQDLQPYIAKADYLVQLSDMEGFGYSVAEALANNTAVLVTPFDTTKELGVKDGVNGYILPFDMNFDVRKLLTVPEFEYEYNNKKIISQWREILGKTKPTKAYKQQNIVSVRVTRRYDDLFFDKTMREGTVFRILEDRAKFLCEELQTVEIIG